MMANRLSTPVCAGLIILPSAALADAAGPLQITTHMVVVREIADGGTRQEVIAPTSRVVPGDKVRIATNFANTGHEPLQGVVLTNQVHPGLELLETGDCEVTVDGGKRFARLGLLTIASADGTARPAELRDVTALRCMIAQVPPGGSGQLAHRALVK